ncbi:ABC transporter ATP-binding protein [Aeromicrobium sp. CTD01-1L150]|uniref:ABC transporter ATP-binding protein n=1 Tax=Aeromicrobium sp. CTD01-1L150 TaxID=3341830 RepID=UPI0035BFEF2D
MTGLLVRGVRAGYTGVDVLHGTDLRVDSGTLVALLGPSGCGKTTLLRTIAGFHRTSDGEILVGHQVVETPEAATPSHRRRITLVPQEGALFPHLDVAANIAFGLKGGPRDEVRERVDQMLDLVGLQAERRRQPHQLSGGQQQRVALARALAPHPDLVLLDEPFSALDAHRRERVREEVRELLASEKATALLVTHDQQEALSLADEVAVMHEGLVRQQDVPSAVYSRPADTWTAQFVGDSVILDAEVDGNRASTPLGPVTVDGPSGSSRVMLRPEQLRLGVGTVRATVRTTRFQGHESMVTAELAGGLEVTVRTRGVGPPPGRDVTVGVDGRGWLLPD